MGNWERQRQNYKAPITSVWQPLILLFLQQARYLPRSRHGRWSHKKGTVNSRLLSAEPLAGWLIIMKTCSMAKCSSTKCSLHKTVNNIGFCFGFRVPGCGFRVPVVCNASLFLCNAPAHYTTCSGQGWVHYEKSGARNHKLVSETRKQEPLLLPSSPFTRTKELSIKGGNFIIGY